MSSRSAVIASVLEDSLNSGTSLARAWEWSRASPQLTIAQVADRSERRLLANLRVLAVRDPSVTKQLLLPALDDDDAHRAFVAAVALLERGDEGVPAVLERQARPESSPLLLHAMSLTSNQRIETALRRVMRAGEDPALLAGALDVLAFRKADAGVDLHGMVAGNPKVARAALRLAHCSGSPVLARTLGEKMLRAADSAVRDAAIEVALIRGSKLAWNVARETAEGGEEGSGVAMLTLAISGEPSDVVRLTKLAGVEASARAALFALGFSGSSLALEACLSAMEQPKLAKVAGEAFSAITGLKVEGPYSQAEESKKPGGAAVPFDEDDLNADLVPGPEVELPTPAAGAVKQWWAVNRARFSADARYLGGATVDGPKLLASFRNGPTRRRPALGLELAVRTRGQWQVDTRQWARVQLARQATEASAPAMSPFRTLLD